MDLKAKARSYILSISDRLIGLSHMIHENPELGFQETRAHQWISEFLSGAAFDVDNGIAGLPTAFKATSGAGALKLAICAEYDCLPEIGHACGHNLIAAMSVGAGIGISAIADAANLSVSVIGTPAEEMGGGKLLLLEKGAFRDVHAAMMVHPYPWDVSEPNIIAAELFDVHYAGRAAHASAFPDQGINAADAQTVAQTAIGLLRQHFRPGDRVHGIITRGGDAPNIIPSQTSARYIIRANNLDELDELRLKVKGCFEAGAIATGAKLTIDQLVKPYAQMRHDSDLAGLYKRNAESLGRSFQELGDLGERLAISTDMGNVSQEIPSIHPMIGINSLPAVNHQAEFAAACVTADADQALIDGAIAMAWTAIDIAKDSVLRNRLMERTL
jgi:amidohydrolase